MAGYVIVVEDCSGPDYRLEFTGVYGPYASPRAAVDALVEFGYRPRGHWSYPDFGAGWEPWKQGIGEVYADIVALAPFAGYGRT